MKAKTRHLEGWLYTAFAVPAVLYLVMFRLIPFLGNCIAFMDYKLLKGFTGSEFIGFTHFIRLFSSDIFWEALVNTLRLNLLDLAVGFPFTIFLSLLLTQLRGSIRNHFQTILYIPHFISWAALGGIIVQMLSPSIGIMGAIGMLFSMDHSKIPLLLGEESSWVAVYVLAGIWQYAGWGTIVYVNYVQRIDSCIYENARIDGASKFQQMFYVTLPIIKPMILVMLLLKLSGILSTSFEQVYALSNSMVLSVSDVLSTYEYRTGIQGMQFSYATAIGLVESMIGLVFIIASRFLISKMNGVQNDYDS